MAHHRLYKTLNGLHRARKRNGYTQKAVMLYLGLKSTARISQWENGERLPSLHNAIKLSILYKCLVDDLFFDVRDNALTDFQQRFEKVNKNKPP